MDDDNLLPFTRPPAPAPKRAPEGASPTVRGWYEALLGLPEEKDPCPGFTRYEWPKVRANALAFLEQHGETAARLGWTAPELFGVHPKMGLIRLDHCGALMASILGPVHEVTDRALKGEKLTAYRDKPGKVCGPPVWEFRAQEPKAPKAPAGWRAGS